MFTIDARSIHLDMFVKELVQKHIAIVTDHGNPVFIALPLTEELLNLGINGYVSNFAKVRGMANTGMSTEEIMKLMRTEPDIEPS